MTTPVDVTTPPPAPASAAASASRITTLATVAALLIAGYWTGRVAFENHHEDLWIYSSGSWFGLQGLSPYDTERIHARVDEKWADDSNLHGNAGFFLSPQALLIFLPYALLPWIWAKLVWCAVTVGLTAAAALGLRNLASGRLPTWFSAAAVVAVLLNPLSLFVLIVGQTTLFLFTCVVFGQWAFVRGWPRVGCLLWALAFFKPHIALPLLPLAWYLYGWKRAAEVAIWVGALNVLVGVAFYGNPLFALEYLSYVQQGHKTVVFNRVEMNRQITSWNRLLVACGGPVTELGAVGMVAGYLVFGLLIAVRVRVLGLSRLRDATSWAFALTGCAILSCCQLLPYELPLVLLGLPYLGELLLSERRRDQVAAGVILLATSFAMIPGGDASAWYRTINYLSLNETAEVILKSHRSLGVLVVTVTVLLNGPVSRFRHIQSEPAGRGERRVTGERSAMASAT